MGVGVALAETHQNHRSINLLPGGPPIGGVLKLHAKEGAAEAQQLVTKPSCMVAWFRGISCGAHALSRASQAAKV
jgi:hypothetical protein